MLVGERERERMDGYARFEREKSSCSPAGLKGEFTRLAERVGGQRVLLSLSKVRKGTAQARLQSPQDGLDQDREGYVLTREGSKNTKDGRR